MASESQRLARIKREIQRRGLLKPTENLLTKETLTNDDRREMFRQLLTSGLPGWIEGSAMFPDDTELTALVSDGTALLEAIERGDEIDFMPKPYTGKYGYKNVLYDTEIEMRAAYQADADNDQTMKTVAYKLQQWQDELTELKG